MPSKSNLYHLPGDLNNFQVTEKPEKPIKLGIFRVI